MPYETISDGLTLIIPTNGTINWGSNLKNQAWRRISAHTHTGSGDGNQIPTGGIEDLAVTTAKLAAGAVTRDKMPDGINTNFQQAILAPTGTSQDIDFANGNKVVLDLNSTTGDVTITLSNPSAGGSYRVKVLQDNPVRQITWPVEILWPQGEEPSQFTQASETFVVWLDYDGTNYLGKWDIAYS